MGELGFFATEAVLPLEVVKVVAVFCLEGLVVEELLGQYFGKAPDDLPVGWAKVGAKGQGYLEVENILQNVWEGPHYIRVMLELTEAALDVVGMNDNIKVRVCDAEVVDVGV